MHYIPEHPRMPDEWYWRLVKLWLRGFQVREKSGLAKRGYLSGRYEEIVRNFLGYAIWQNLDMPWEVRMLLAASFAVETESYFQSPTDRILELKFRKAGRRPDGYRDRDIIARILKRLKTTPKVEACIAGVCAEVGLSRSEVMAVWGRWKDSGLELETIGNMLGMDIITYMEQTKVRSLI